MNDKPLSLSTLSITIALMIGITGAFAQQLTLNAKVEKIAEGFEFVEGPVWKDGRLLFSDIPANTVYQYTPAEGATVFLKPSGNSNGLAIDLNGQLLLGRHGKRRLARITDNGIETSLASHYQGKQFNSPNDMAIKSDGSIFFTDPPYGVTPEREVLGFYGIYRLTPDGRLKLLDKSMDRPNGITFSPDESILYVGDSESRRIYVWDVVSDTAIANKRLFAFMDAEGYTDGMKVDAEGRLFATGPFGVWVFDTNGTVLDTIMIPGQTANCTWGNADGRTLYVTSEDAVYRVSNIYHK